MPTASRIRSSASPYQAHGIPNARDTLKHIKKDPDRTMVVIDPRRSETAKQADIHLQLKPGTDAFLMSAMLAIIVREGLPARHFLRRPDGALGKNDPFRELAPK